MEFVAWEKTPRLYRDVVITEKIDGTNAAVVIEKVDPARGAEVTEDPNVINYVSYDGEGYVVGAQSRKRLITPENDNFGFARWVAENSGALVETLGEGRHFGEWWGSGIQRAYGLKNGEKYFSLFNTARWYDDETGALALFNSGIPNLTVVPIIYRGTFSEDAIRIALDSLRYGGSFAQPGFKDAEGVVVFHTQSRQVYKVLLENDEISKTEALALSAVA